MQRNRNFSLVSLSRASLSRVCLGMTCLLLQQTHALAQFQIQPPRSEQSPRSTSPEFRPLPSPYRVTVPDHTVLDYPDDLSPRLPRRQTTTSAAERIEHLKKAAENLKLAGFEQEAVELRRRAAQLQLEMMRDRSDSSSPQLIAEIRELRQSVHQLRGEMQALRNLLERQLSGPNGVGSFNAEALRKQHEARIRLPDRGSRISDEELDAPLDEGDDVVRPPVREQPGHRPSEDHPDVEFELVPVPVPVEMEANEPSPTPVRPEKQAR